MHITHCPECATAFKVTPEQLQLAGGWVRCGRCGAVFEANKHVQPVSEQVQPPAITEVQTQSQSEPQLQPQPQLQPPSPDPLPLSVMSAAEPALHDGWLDVASSARIEHDAPESTVAKKTQAYWAAACVLLLVTLLWQSVLYKRDGLMAHEPSLQGVLSALCAPVGCEPKWPHVPDALQIDGSSFTRDPQGFYSVQLRIKNTEHYILAAPHVELSLLDVYDDVVVRRVFSPEELKLAAQISPLRDARASVNFDLQETVAPRVTGYRVFLFYP